MLTACWSVKGGSGTTVVAAAMAMGLARVGRPVVVVDFGGDLSAALGVPEPDGPGVLDWLAAGPSVPNDGLARIAHSASEQITVVPRDNAAVNAGDADAGRRLAASLASLGSGPVIADCGRVESAALRSFVASADRSFLVLKPCYLAMRRALNAPRPTAVVLVHDPARLRRADEVESILGVPVVAEIDWQARIAKAVNDGLLRSRMPRRVVATLRDAAA